MKCHTRKFLGLILGLSMTLGAAAHDDHGHTLRQIGTAPGIGYTIKVITPNGIAQTSGQTAKIEGDILLQGVSHGQQRHLGDLRALLARQGVQIRAFFPDAMTEVTQQLTIDSALHFKFQSGPLNAGDLNVFSVMVTGHSTHFRELQKTQAKLDIRVAKFTNVLSALIARHAPTREINGVQGLIARLQNLSARITQKLLMDNQTLAEARFPLQVDNLVSQSSLTSTLQGKFKLLISYAVGSLIEGGKTQITSTVTNLRGHGEDDDDDGENSRWIIQYIFNGVVVKEVGPQRIAGAVTDVYSTAALESGANTFEIKVVSADRAHDRGKLFASLSLEEPVAVDNTAPLLTVTSPDPAAQYLQTMQPVSAVAMDPFGLIDPASIQARLTGTLDTGTPIDLNATPFLQLTQSGAGQSYSIAEDLNPLLEGEYTYSLKAADQGGNDASAFTASFRIDRTAPVITTDRADGILTNTRQFPINVVVSDRSPTISSVSVNSTKIFESDAPAFAAPVTLNEGMNFIEIASSDAAANTAAPVTFFNITLDTTPAILSLQSPQEGQIFNSLGITIFGTANEILNDISVNGNPMTLSADKKSFTGLVSASVEGSFGLRFEAHDLAGNLSTRDVTVQIVLKILNGDLISATPTPDGTHLNIRGTSGASRPGLTINASAGFFNSGSAVSAADGSFLITLTFFSSAVLSATDPAQNRTETVTLDYAAQTVLSGAVKDSEGHPLAGATVSILNTALAAVTDGSGVFRFQSPPSGDQKLVIDGTTIPNSGNGPLKRYSKTNIAISIGIGQNNILKTVFLMPVLLDGTETHIAAGGAAFVTSPHAPGVALDIPAGSVTFPDGTNTGDISISTIDSRFSTIPPLGVAVPNKVIALEPSGLKFNQSVELTVPNDNELPPGTDVVIFSMNSNKGIWEIGGVGRVTDNGQNIVTKPNMGLRHFSIVYASPTGPVINQLGAQDRPGTDTFNGNLSTSIVMPSYRSLGQSVSPTLIYKSSWAKPTVVTTNIFDVPRRDIVANLALEFGQEGAYKVFVQETQHGWFEPDFVKAQFLTTQITGEQVTFTGLPNQSLVSYALELKDPTTGAYMASGVYPYLSKWEMHLKQMIMHSRQIRLWREDTGSNDLIRQDSFLETRQIEQLFPSDFQGILVAQNHVTSSAGRGWRVGGAQNIANPAADRILIEEADGGISTYMIGNSITTLFASSSGEDLNQGSDIGYYPIAYTTAPATTFQAGGGSGGLMVITRQENINAVDLAGGQNAVLNQFTLPSSFGARIYGNDGGHATINDNGSQGPTVGGTTLDLQYLAFRRPGQILRLPDGRMFITDGAGHQIVQVGLDGAVTVIGGGSKTQVPTFANNPSPLCSPRTIVGAGADGIGARIAARNFACSMPDYSFCGAVNSFETTLTCSSGKIPQPGFNGDGAPGTSVLLNTPLGITAGATTNTIVFADTGNNLVRQLNLATNAIQTIAGNGQTVDFGDGSLATAAGIYHPRGVIYDSVGNLYITSENGFVRKVDTNGIITRLAGSTIAEGGTVGENIPAETVLLSRPTGMAIDNARGYLYIADSGNNVVRRINLLNHVMNTVAGNYVGGFTGDGPSAINVSLSNPNWLGLDPSGNLLISDAGNQRIRRVVFQNNADGSIAFAPTSQDHSTLVKNGDGTWARGYRSGGKVFFDSVGREVSTLDRIGRTNTFTYNAQGQLVSITDPTGQTVQYGYSGGVLTTIMDPAGRVTMLSYNGNYLAGVTFPGGTTRSYQYNADGLLSSETNERGHSTTYGYNQFNRLATVTKADGSTITINDSGSATASNNYTGGNQGTLKSMGTSQGQVYDGIVDAKSVETKFLKDNAGFVTTVIDGAGRTTHVARNAKGLPTQITRPDGTSVTFNYDPSTDDLLSQTDSGTGITTSQTVDAYGALLTSTNGRGYTSTNMIDPNTGLVLANADPLGHGMSFVYNALGLPTQITDVLGKSSSIAYNAFGNAVSVTDAKGATTMSTLDAAGNIVAVADAKSQVTLYTFDAFNRLMSVTTPKNETTQYVYLPTGELAQVTDPLGNVMTFEYNSLGQVVKKTDALGFVTVRGYDENGNMTTETDPNGNVKTYSYDSLNRLTKKTLPDNVVTLYYDVRSNLSQAANEQSVVDFNVDVAGRLTSTRSRGLGAYAGLPDVILSYSYDNANNRIALTSPVGMTNYSFDEANRLTSLTNPFGEAFTFGYTAANQLSAVTRPGSHIALAFDNAGFVSSIVHTANGGQVLASFAYQLDAIGNRTAITTKAGTRSLAYDANSQLTSATNPESGAVANADAIAAATETFSHDVVANRTTDQGGGYAYDAKKQRLTEDYRNFYFWDNNGNLISKQQKGMSGPVTNFQYSSENQMRGFKLYDPAFSATNPALEVTYVYDALGRRLAKSVVDHRAAADQTKTFTRRYAYNGGEVLLEYSGANQLLASYTQSGLSADSQIAANITAAGVTAALAPTARSYQFIKDAQGTVVDITDNSGNLVQHYIYSVFGVIIGIQDANAADVTANPPVRTSFTYTGREHDSESGFYYYRARYYDPYSGRFLQKDPEPGRLDLPSTMINGYVYAGSNPANNSDPSGRAWWQLAAVIAITVIVTVVAAILTGPGAGPIAYAVAGMLSGAIIGASAAAIYGQNVGEAAARGAIMGAITGAAAGVGSAIGSAATAANAVGAVVTSVVVGALIGAVGFGIAGFDPAQGAIAGAIAGGMAAYRAASRSLATTATTQSQLAGNAFTWGCVAFVVVWAIGGRLGVGPAIESAIRGATNPVPTPTPSPTPTPTPTPEASQSTEGSNSCSPPNWA